MTVKSSAMEASCGNTSDIQMPDWPRCENFWGVPSNLGTPDVNAKRFPFSSESGHGWSLRFTSSGL